MDLTVDATISIVGRNVSGGRLAIYLKKKFPNLQVHWFTEDGYIETENDFYIFERDTKRMEGRAWQLLQKIAYCVGETKFFAESELPSLFSPWIVNKIIRCCCYRDLTPLVFHSGFGRVQIDPLWPKKKSVSESFYNMESTGGLARWGELLDNLKNLAQSLQVVVEDSLKQVRSISITKLENPKLVLSAPHGFWESHAVVSAQADDKKLFEIDGASDRTWVRHWHPTAYWKSYGAWVDRKKVTALPLFSIWLNPKSSKNFLSTGYLGNESFFRVICVPNNFEKSWLQIDVLHFYEDKNPCVFKNPFQILAKLCPQLEIEEKHISECILNENILYELPHALWHDYHEKVAFYYANQIGHEDIFHGKFTLKGV